MNASPLAVTNCCPRQNGRNGTKELQLADSDLKGDLSARQWFTDRTFRFQLHANEYKPYGIPVIMPRDLVDGSISEAIIARVGLETSRRLSRHRVQPGDIVLARRGEIGRCALVMSQNKAGFAELACLRVRLIDDVLPEFVFRLIAAEENVKWLQQNAVGQTMLNLSAIVLGRLPLSLPPLPEQRRIVEILDEADAAVRTTEALIAAKLKHKRAWAERLLTGARAVPGVRGGGVAGCQVE